MTEFNWGRKSELANLEKSNAFKVESTTSQFSAQMENQSNIPQPKSNQDKLILHRSAFLSHKNCPRMAYLYYWYNGHGLSSFAIPQHLLIGICVHRGLQHLLEHCRLEHPNGDFEEKCIDDAIDWGHKVFNDVIQKREIELKYGEDLQYTVIEVYNLIEALIRSYAIYRLRTFLEEYEILEVEKEEVYEALSNYFVWLGKADGLLRRRRDNELVVLSFKTASEFAYNTMGNIQIDMQGVSEIVAIENRLNTILNDILSRLENRSNNTDTILATGYNISDQLWRYIMYQARGNNKIKIRANQYEFLIKGKHKKDSSNPSHYQYQTHLLHPIKIDGIVNVGLSGLSFGQIQSEYEWVSGSGRLPKNKRKINIYNDIGIKEWINKLARLEIQPEEGNPFKDIIIANCEGVSEDRCTFVRRTDEQINEWKINTAYEGELISKRLEQVYNNSDFKEEFLIKFFPKDGADKHLCYEYYGSKCPFVAICHENMIPNDGLESGMFVIREPHHELERNKFIEKGWIKEGD